MGIVCWLVFGGEQCTTILDNLHLQTPDSYHHHLGIKATLSLSLSLDYSLSNITIIESQKKPIWFTYILDTTSDLIKTKTKIFPPPKKTHDFSFLSPSTKFHLSLTLYQLSLSPTTLRLSLSHPYHHTTTTITIIFCCSTSITSSCSLLIVVF